MNINDWDDYQQLQMQDSERLQRELNDYRFSECELIPVAQESQGIPQPESGDNHGM